MKKEYSGQSKKSGVYKITNQINGKIYIGSAKCFQVRASQHHNSLKNNKHQNKHLQASFNKHGSDAFLFEVLKVVSGDKKTRTAVEQSYFDMILKNEKWNLCFNFSKKAIAKDRSCFSNTPDETSKKLKAAQKRLWKDPEHRKKLSEARKEMWKNPEYREKMKVAMRKVFDSPEYKQKLSEARKKTWQDPKYRKKMSEIKNSAEYKENAAKQTSALWQDPEYRAKMEEIHNTPAFKQKMTTINKEKWDKPGFRENMVKQGKERWEDPEYAAESMKTITAARQDPDYRKRQADKMKELWSDPAFKQARVKRIRDKNAAMSEVDKEAQKLANRKRALKNGICKAVEQWSKDGKTLIHIWSSLTEAAREVEKVQSGHLADHLKPDTKRKSVGGYTWKLHN